MIEALIILGVIFIVFVGVTFYKIAKGLKDE